MPWRRFVTLSDPRRESTAEVTYVDHLSQGSIEGAKMVKRIMLNASACLMNADLGKNASEIEWATTQALRADAASAVATTVEDALEPRWSMNTRWRKL